jgi:hypothetical protein
MSELAGDCVLGCFMSSIVCPFLLLKFSGVACAAGCGRLLGSSFLSFTLWTVEHSCISHETVSLQVIALQSNARWGDLKCTTALRVVGSVLSSCRVSIGLLSLVADLSCLAID